MAELTNSKQLLIVGISVEFTRISSSCMFIIDDLNTTDNNRNYSLFILATVQ